MGLGDSEGTLVSVEASALACDSILDAMLQDLKGTSWHHTKI